MTDVVIRREGPAAVEPAMAVWRSADAARRGDRAPGPGHEARGRVGKPGVFLLVAEARARGYDRTQLWTQRDKPCARRLYEGRGYRRSGREKDELGERIPHFERTL